MLAAGSVTSRPLTRFVLASVLAHHRKPSMDTTDTDVDCPVGNVAADDAVLLSPEDVASDFVDRAADDFALIARLKETFYRDIYEDGRWRECYSYADMSRRYSSLIRMVFALARRKHPALTFPSSSEVNVWFSLFSQRDALRQKNVPEHLLPPNRGVAAALASATAACDSLGQKQEAQKAILLKFADESARAEKAKCKPLPLTASTVREIAATMGLRKPRPPKPVTQREFDDIDRSAWEQVCSLVHELRLVLLSQLEAADEHAKALALTRKLEQLTLGHPSFVFGVFDAKEGFVSLLYEHFMPKVMRTEDGVRLAKRHVGFVQRKGGPAACWSSVGFERHPLGPTSQPGADLPVISVQLTEDGAIFEPDEASRIVQAVNESEMFSIRDRAITALGATVEPIALATWREWESRGGIPIGTFVDEVLEPDFDDDPADDVDADDSDDDID